MKMSFAIFDKESRKRQDAATADFEAFSIGNQNIFNIKGQMYVHTWIFFPGMTQSQRTITIKKFSDVGIVAQSNPALGKWAREKCYLPFSFPRLQSRFYKLSDFINVDVTGITNIDVRALIFAASRGDPIVYEDDSSGSESSSSYEDGDEVHVSLPSENDDQPEGCGSSRAALQNSNTSMKLTYSIVNPETLGNVIDEKLRLAALDQKFSEIEKRLSDVTDRLQTIFQENQVKLGALDAKYISDMKDRDAKYNSEMEARGAKYVSDMAVRDKLFNETHQTIVKNAINAFYASMNDKRIAKVMTVEETRREAISRLCKDEGTIAKAVEALKTDGNIRSMAVSQLSSLPETRSAAIAKLQRDGGIRKLVVQELQSAEEIKRQAVQELQERLEPIVREQLTTKRKRQIDQELEAYRDFHMKKIREDNGVEEPEQPAAQDVELVLNLLK